MENAMVVFRSAALAISLVAGALPVAAQTLTKEKVVAALSQLDLLASELVANEKVPGLSIAVVYRGEAVYLKGFGIREAGKSERVDEDTVFQLASLSKPIASTIVAALANEGNLTWNTRIRDIDPLFRLYESYATEAATIADLFAHRSGLWGDAGNDLESLGFGRDEILSRLRFLRPAYTFRGHFAYSNFGLTAGAIAAAKTTRLTWEELAQQKLYGPLGMASTSSRYADFLTKQNRAALHVLVGGKWQVKMTRQPDAQSPAGGVSSSARDLAQWMRLQLSHGTLDGMRIIKADALAETHLPAILRGRNPISDEPSFYGLGWVIDYSNRGVRLSHGGAFSAGVRTAIELLPSEQLGILILCNAFPTGVPEGVAASFFDLVFDGTTSRDWVSEWNSYIEAAYGAQFVAAATAPFAQRPASPSLSLPLPTYEGVFMNDYVGRAAVTVSDGVLTLGLGPDGVLRLPLHHFDRDLFVVYPSEEAPDYPTAVTFSIGPDQKADEIVIEMLNGNG
jgi:CubicO group peptidase (beta-lactamase class C family)